MSLRTRSLRGHRPCLLVWECLLLTSAHFSVGLFALWGPQSPLSVLDIRLLLVLCAVNIISQSEACLVTFTKVELDDFNGVLSCC